MFEHALHRVNVKIFSITIDVWIRSSIKYAYSLLIIESMGQVKWWTQRCYYK